MLFNRQAISDHSIPHYCDVVIVSCCLRLILHNAAASSPAIQKIVELLASKCQRQTEKHSLVSSQLKVCR